MTNRLKGWKGKYLSLARRHMLAQYVLNAIPIYTMQVIMLPKGVSQAIKKNIHNFLWGGYSGDKKCSLVGWHKVIDRKSEGGLGIRNIQDMNKACPSKLDWRLGKVKDSLWAQKPLHNCALKLVVSTNY